MKHLRRFNESKLIKARDETIKKIVDEEINKLGHEADLNHIDVSEVTSMKFLFYDKNFNGDISFWNTKNVKSMKGMFYTSHFKGDISLWNTENVEDMHGTFHKSEFDRDISKWNIEKVYSINLMFQESRFNGDLNKWKPRSLELYIVPFSGSPLEGKEPIWWKCLRLGLFNTGEDYCDSLKYDWLREKTIYMGRLKTTIEIFDGNLKNADVIKNLKHFTFEN